MIALRKKCSGSKLNGRERNEGEVHSSSNMLIALSMPRVM